MQTMKNVPRGLLLAALLASTLIGQSQSPNTAVSKPSSDQIERITLPQVPTEIPKGPNMQVYEKNCLICHSARYVITQPRFSRAAWQSEVKKMVDSYGASISPADQALIVEYLVAVKGSEPPATTPAK
jgi:sulfite dehydrogenase (cytochrome) subunit B